MQGKSPTANAVLSRMLQDDCSLQQKVAKDRAREYVFVSVYESLHYMIHTYIILTYTCNAFININYKHTHTHKTPREGAEADPWSGQERLAQ
jgi:hypothetical protein